MRSKCVYFKGTCTAANCTWQGYGKECTWHGAIVPTDKHGEEADLLQLGIVKRGRRYSIITADR